MLKLGLPAPHPRCALAHHTPRKHFKPPLLTPAMQKQQQPPAVEQTLGFWLMLAYTLYVFPGALWLHCWHQPQTDPRTSCMLSFSPEVLLSTVQFAFPVLSCMFGSWLTRSSWHLKVLFHYLHVEIHVRTVVFNRMARKPQGRLSNLVWYLYLVSSGEPIQKGRAWFFTTALLLWSCVYLLCDGNQWGFCSAFHETFPSANASLQHVQSEVNWRHWAAGGDLHFMSW